MKKPSKKVLAILLGVGSVAVGAPGLWMYNYTEHNPKFCTSCHVMGDAYGRWEKSAHSKNECHDCHISTMADNVMRLYNAVFEPKDEVTSHAHVDKTVCLACHESQGGDRWRKVMETAGHRFHMAKAKDRKPIQCVDCHSKGVHEFEPAVDLCQNCHKSVQVHEGKMESLECLDCHDFLAEAETVAGVRPPAKNCRRCHDEEPPPTDESGRVVDHGVKKGQPAAPGADDGDASTPEPGEVRPATGEAEDPLAVSARPPRARTSTSTPLPSNGYAGIVPEEWVHGSVDCRECHHPHETDAETRRTGTSCANCHRAAPRALSTGPEEHRKCFSCHAGHAERGFPEKACQGCHEGKKAELHPKSCSNCHKQHNFRADGRDCTSCHSDKALQLFEEAPKKHDPCTGCHDPHEGRKPGQACASCHKKIGHDVVLAAPERHRQCVGCHEPHGKRPDGMKACAECHEAQLAGMPSRQSPPVVAAKAGEKVPHDQCLECHATKHGSPEVGAAACAKSCHEKQVVRADALKGPPEHKNCASCHKPHQPSLKIDQQACAKCHEAQAGGDLADVHKGDCRTCHPPHENPKVPVSNCRGCHEKVHPKAPKAADDHRTCQSCHKPHRSKASAKDQCATCHEKQRDSLVAWRDNPDHLRCASCHEGHDVTRLKDCGSCHEKQAKGMASGKHEACKSCHLPHEMRELGPAPKWKECVRCHEGEVLAASKRGATHSQCKECHEPHAFAKPTCESCHNPIRGQLMHQVSAHQTCTDCHEKHAATPPPRARCESCHKDKTQHFPEVQQCATCHPFKRPTRTASLP